MYASLLLPIIGAVVASAQGEGEGYPAPPPTTLTTTQSGVLISIPTETGAFTGLELIEGAIVNDGPANPTFQPALGPATTQTSLPAATYQAVLPTTNFDNGTGSTIEGSITISSAADGSGVSVNVNFTGFPSEAEYGAFVYHIHNLAVPADGNCSATLGHLDPTDRGEYYPCNVATPDTCQVGDLAGKHGNITTTPFTAQYTDAFLSTDPSSASFFGDKSIVIHSSNTTRLTCANFQLVSGSSSSNGSSPTTGSGNSSTPSITPFTGDASRVSGFGVAALFAGLAAFLL